jgi:hypothetical protein
MAFESINQFDTMLMNTNNALYDTLTCLASFCKALFLA